MQIRVVSRALSRPFGGRGGVFFCLVGTPLNPPLTKGGPQGLAALWTPAGKCSVRGEGGGGREGICSSGERPFLGSPTGRLRGLNCAPSEGPRAPGKNPRHSPDGVTD
ncbi:hypothetical protein ACFTAO_34655 [Paenibacillus rhizoplanae]